MSADVPVGNSREEDSHHTIVRRVSAMLIASYAPANAINDQKRPSSLKIFIEPSVLLH